MKENLTYIAVILDRSGSMSSVKAATIAGFNSFVDEQRQTPGEALFTLVQFGSPRELSETYTELAFDKVKPLDNESYQPTSQSTALYDAIGYTITRIGERLSNRPESERPSKVLVLIQTDGFENASRAYDRIEVAKMIKHQRDKYSWDFAFIGASEAAVTDAIDLGVAANFTTAYAATSEGTGQVLHAASVGLRAYRNSSREEVATMDFFPQADSDGS